MKVLFLSLLCLVTLAFPARADTGLTPIKPSHVCMINNKAYDKDQIKVEVDGKVYYGCCPACKAMLTNDPATRTATDPVSGAVIDKATAVIGADASGATFYFENEKNLHAYTPPAAQ